MNGIPQQGRTTPNLYSIALALSNHSQIEAKQRQRMEPTIVLQTGEPLTKPQAVKSHTARLFYFSSPFLLRTPLTLIDTVTSIYRDTQPQCKYRVFLIV